MSASIYKHPQGFKNPLCRKYQRAKWILFDVQTLRFILECCKQEILLIRFSASRDLSLAEGDVCQQGTIACRIRCLDRGILLQHDDTFTVCLKIDSGGKGGRGNMAMAAMCSRRRHISRGNIYHCDSAMLTGKLVKRTTRKMNSEPGDSNGARDRLFVTFAINSVQMDLLATGSLNDNTPCRFNRKAIKMSIISQLLRCD